MNFGGQMINLKVYYRIINRIRKFFGLIPIIHLKVTTKKFKCERKSLRMPDAWLEDRQSPKPTVINGISDKDIIEMLQNEYEIQVTQKKEII